MANYTLTVYSSQTSVLVGDQYDSSGSFITSSDEGNFDFSFGDILNFTINSISITAPVKYVSNWGGGKTTSSLKIGSTQVATYGSGRRSTWSASNLSVSGGTALLNLKNDTSGSAANGIKYGQATAIISYSAELTSDAISPLDGQEIASSLLNIFSWTNTCPASTVTSTKLFWKYINDSNYTEINIENNAEEYSFESGYFNNDTIQWYVSIQDSEGNIANTSVQTVSIGIIPTVEIAYPANVNIRNSNQQIFTWEMSESISTGQKLYEIQYRKTSETNWTTLTGTTANQYHEFAANTFDTATYEWKLKVTNNDNISTEYVSASFNAIGATNAPNITNITNSSIPTITWTISSQDTFELEIYNGDNRLYASGVQVGIDVRSFTPNLILDDGNYIVKMRAMNEYGYFTEWSEYSFVLSTEKPEAVNCIVYANDTHGINIIKAGGEADELFVLKRLFGAEKWKIIGKLEDTFIDNTVISDTKYEYALRNYETNAGYTDSNVVAMIINYQGLIIYDGSEFVQLFKTEDEQFDISHSPSKTYAYSYTIGRKYPIRESSEWMSHTTSFSCFISFEDYEKLETFYESNDALWFKNVDFSFKCSLDSIQIKETLLGKGYNIGISLSRIDEEEVNLIE